MADYGQLQRYLQQGRTIRSEMDWDAWAAMCLEQIDDADFEDVNELVALENHSDFVEKMLERLPTSVLRRISVIVAIRLLLSRLVGQELLSPRWYLITSNDYLAYLENFLSREGDARLMLSSPGGNLVVADLEEDLQLPEIWIDYIQRYGNRNVDITNINVLQAQMDHLGEVEIGEQLLPGGAAATAVNWALGVVRNGDRDEEDMGIAIVNLAWSYGLALAKREAMLHNNFPPNGELWRYWRNHGVEDFFYTWWKLVACKFPWVQ